MGHFIAMIRKSKSFTQAELANKLSVTNKAVSKWETGRGMPDVSLLKPLSQILEVTINEVLSGEIINEGETITQMDTNIETIIKMMEKLNRNKNIIIGVLIFVFGLILIGIGGTETNSNFGDFMSGLATGLSVGSMLIGIIIILCNLVKSTDIKDI